MIAFIPIVVLIAGLLVYAFAANPKLVEAGRLAYACGLLAVMFQLAGKMLRLLTFAVLVGSLLTACAYCKDAANANTARCKTERVLVNCGAPEVIKLVKEIAAKVFVAVMSQNYDALLGDIMAQLKTDGATDPLGIVTCAVNEATSKSTVSPNSNDYTVLSTHAQVWKNAHPVKVK